MRLKLYQELSKCTVLPSVKNNHEYFVLGLNGEAGEVAELFKKAIRKQAPIDVKHLKEELGDVLWYLSQLASVCNIDLEEVAADNLDKLAERAVNGRIIQR